MREEEVTWGLVDADDYLTSPVPRPLTAIPTTRWGAGNYAPQWITVELAEPSKIGGVRLLVEQSPEGHTVHEVAGCSTACRLEGTPP